MYDFATVTEAPQETWVTAEYPEHDMSLAFTEGIDGDRSKPRRYLVNGEKWPSVTTILDKHTSRDGLSFWYENIAIEGMIAIQQEAAAEFDPKTGHMPQMPADLKAARRALWMAGTTGEQIKNAAGLAGDVIHQALENWHVYQEIPSLAMVEESKRGKMQALAAFLYDARPDLQSSEILVASRRYRYAGRPDARLALYKPTIMPVQLTQDYDSVEPRVVPPGIYLADVKSGSKLHPETGIQLALYEQACRELGYQRTDGRFAIHLREDGTYAIRFFDQRLRTATKMVEFYYANIEDNKRSTARNKRLVRAA